MPKLICAFTGLTCADPENFVRGGPNLITLFFVLFFLIDEGIEDRNTTIKYGPSSAASKRPFTWRFPGGPMIVQH